MMRVEKVCTQIAAALLNLIRLLALTNASAHPGVFPGTF
jgi:hypothetical protein